MKSHLVYLHAVPDSAKILLVYDARSVPHTDEVRATRNFLREQLGVTILFDETDIPQHKSPVDWFVIFI